MYVKVCPTVCEVSLCVVLRIVSGLAHNQMTHQMQRTSGREQESKRRKRVCVERERFSKNFEYFQKYILILCSPNHHHHHCDVQEYLVKLNVNRLRRQEREEDDDDTKVRRQIARME